ncbi:group 1 glycosyl transferase [Acetobacter aceti NRIC 0242]|uniref:Glycosyl transferase n=1 Tax=Acetobacter aceti NBRC 14818 TaxID=887700 RepID=A0AB33IFT4_ACEAC|nr:glycosyltransferase family 4 protein [Acetobacter aceti]TCS32800.1 glycosyltransferase involved in cell wall biosynthesis [Acetobacter aceti NBRC 14818]BCK74787.1 glycosyl transferase [Acetobacter aceti NBRC 14818]GAN58082.1 glycosyl transferase [Acetobacter aceti NBRC 14818]GBO81030.1 group 1 glycosyl transferase [Acetobacter aceti NRIC 0242]
MRIAQIAPLHEAVPPKLYGGTERVVAFLTDELVKMGHDVTLFASGDSVTSATLDAVWPRALRLDPAIRDPIAPHMLLMERAAQRADDFDILHFHMDYWPFTYFSRQKTPFVTTMHGRLDLMELQPVFDAFPQVPIVSISDSQRRPLPQARYAGTVLHGLPEHLLTPQPGPRDYLAFLGRICPEKGIDKAIRIARAVGMPLKIAAKVDKVDVEYFERDILPMLGDGVELVGEINDTQKSAFLSGARALLMPIDWPEPFGLVMIEAMACGTPVIAFRHGSVPEVIEDGVTGAIVTNEKEAIAAYSRVEKLDPASIRREFEKRFTARRMAEDYLAIYQTLIEERTGKTSRQ